MKFNYETGTASVKLEHGVVLVGGDAHYWPGDPTTAQRAFVKFAAKMKPKVVVMNGDALDAPTISRHPPIGWEAFPTVAEELEACKTRLGEIIKASPKAEHYWPLGNHDARFNTRLAATVPEYRGVRGTRLMHHFPDWSPCWAVEMGGKYGVVIKHKWKGGTNAPYNNALASGRSVVTGHHHSQKVVPVTDYNGTRWGVDAGCLCDPHGPMFTYSENNPRDHRSGFAVLSWWKGTFLPPELVTVMDERKGLVTFRGEVIHV